MTSPRPAWVCAPGIRRIPNLGVFLDDFDLKTAPTGDVEAVLGWGLKPSSRVGRAFSARTGLPYISLEDGFLRSVGLGETGATSLSMIVDDLGVYYDASRPSRLEALISDAPQWCGPDLQARARALIDRMVASGVSKTNMGEALDPAVLKPGRRILLVDQTAGDASIEYGLADAESFLRMVVAAREAEPDAQLIVKRHPAVAAGRKRGCIPEADLGGCTLIDTDVRPADLLAAVDAVYTVTSGLGFEALLRALPVHCFGAPFYAGWGLTTDAVVTSRRGQPRTIEQIAAAALIRYSRYVDPVTGRRCEAEDALERLISLRDRAERLAGYWAGAGFAPAKQPTIRRLLNAPKARLDYFSGPRSAAAQAERRNGRLVWWAGKETAAIRETARGFGGPTVRVEDGFIRSRGLGSDFFGALSVVADDLGVYYDATRPSRLETMLEMVPPSPATLARARDLRARIVETGLSKYNLKGGQAPVWPSGRTRILVVGQVENDKSIEKGCADIRTNAGLVAAVRAAHPDAFIVYRNHPDVLAGNRPGRLDAAATGMVNDVADGLDIIACMDGTDAVGTLTSLTGFEALMRGKRVMTWGRPFYAGWGLTEDTLDFPRRTRRLTLDALVAGALIDYPLYIAPNGWPCEAEDLVEALIAARDTPTEAPPSGQVARWLKGFIASLDRTPPPSY